MMKNETQVIKLNPNETVETKKEIESVEKPQDSRDLVLKDNVIEEADEVEIVSDQIL